MRPGIVVVTLFAIACGGGAATGPGDGGSNGVADASEDAAGADATEVACIQHDLPREIEFEFDGTMRSALLAGPDALPDTPLPLVLNFHGFSDGPELQETFSEMSEGAVDQDYVVAYPKGTGLVKGWNAGACCGVAVTNDVDDVGFTEALIEKIAEVSCIDTDRVFATGYSNGGFLSHRLACELSDRIAGIAPVSGVMGMETCSPTRAIPVLQMHGTADVTVPYVGSLALGFSSVDESMEGWRTRLSCDDAEPTVFFEEGDTTCVQWSGCLAPLGLCTIDGGGHTWPGGAAPLIRGKTSTDLDANAMLLQFLDVL